jgi:peptide/nickel transport system substrate-binding protein
MLGVRTSYLRWLVVIGVLSLALSFLLVSSVAVYGADEDVVRVRARGGKDIDNMDPAHHIGNEEYNINLALYSRLMRYKPGSKELMLDAAESIDVNEDGTVIEFKLKEGIKFHKGYGEMTAEDVKFSYERIIDPEENSEMKFEWKTLERVEVTGKYSGKIILSEPLASLWTTTIPYSSGAIISKEAYEDKGGDRFATSPIGSGPYYWKEWQPSQKIVLERFPDYFGEQPDFKTIEIYPMEDVKVAELAFDRGELDETSISLDSIQRYEGKDGVDTHFLTNLRYHWFGMNVKEPPFDDVKVRKAVRQAININEVIQGAYNGVPDRNDCMLPDEILGHWEGCPTHEQNLDRAKEFMKEAGYPDGFETTIYIYSGGKPELAAQIIQQQLLNIGINTRIKAVENAYESVGKKSVPGAHYFTYSLTLDPGYWFEWFTCDQVGKWNYWKWCNEEFSELSEKASKIMDREERAEMYVEMQKIIDEEVPAVSITNGANAHISDDDVKPVYLAQYSQYQYWEKE